MVKNRVPSVRFDWDERGKQWNIVGVDGAGVVRARCAVETESPVDEFVLARCVVACARELASLLPYVDF